MIRQLLKAVLIPALVLISSTTCFGQFTQDIRYGIKPKGKIRSYTSSQADVNDTLFKEISSIYYSEYNRKGQLIKSWKANKLNEESLDTKYVKTFTYDKKSNLTEVMHFNSKGEPSEKDTYVYSQSGRFIIIKKHMYNGDTSRTSEQFRIDASGKILESYTYYAKTDTTPMLLQTRIHYKYNALGQRIEEVAYNANNRQTSKRINEYNDKGNLTRFTYEKDPLFDGAFNNTAYDSHNNWTSSLLFRFGKPAARFKREIIYYK
ncbi:MAG: hypothetical protein V4560_18075 [Bacteroidota bacterium]